MAQHKALALLSGGLDSQLAIRVIQAQGIPVQAVTFWAPFHSNPASGDKLVAVGAAERLGVPITVLRETEAFLRLIKNPPHGYGRNMNPCIDCHAFMIRRTGELMAELGGDFIITGEVLGQRPMSQMRGSLRVVEKDSGLEGYLLRPLSAKLLPATIPEERGWVDRERLLALQGRSRKPQMALAEQYGVEEYPGPAGGCLATDPEFSHRLRDLLDHGDASGNDMELLKQGRHFRLDPATKAAVGRDHEDNLRILELAQPGDQLLELTDRPGPLTLLRGEPSDANLRAAAALTARYSKAKDEPTAAVGVRAPESREPDRVLHARPATQADVDRLVIQKVRN